MSQALYFLLIRNIPHHSTLNHFNLQFYPNPRKWATYNQGRIKVLLSVYYKGIICASFVQNSTDGAQIVHRWCTEI